MNTFMHFRHHIIRWWQPFFLLRFLLLCCDAAVAARTSSTTIGTTHSLHEKVLKIQSKARRGGLEQMLIVVLYRFHTKLWMASQTAHRIHNANSKNSPRLKNKLSASLPIVAKSLFASSVGNNKLLGLLGKRRISLNRHENMNTPKISLHRGQIHTEDALFLTSRKRRLGEELWRQRWLFEMMWFHWSVTSCTTWNSPSIRWQSRHAQSSFLLKQDLPKPREKN